MSEKITGPFGFWTFPVLNTLVSIFSTHFASNSNPEKIEYNINEEKIADLIAERVKDIVKNIKFPPQPSPPLQPQPQPQPQPQSLPPIIIQQPQQQEKTEPATTSTVDVNAAAVTNIERMVWTDWRGRERKMEIHREVK